MFTTQLNCSYKKKNWKWKWKIRQKVERLEMLLNIVGVFLAQHSFCFQKIFVIFWILLPFFFLIKEIIGAKKDINFWVFCLLVEKGHKILSKKKKGFFVPVQLFQYNRRKEFFFAIFSAFQSSSFLSLSYFSSQS